MSFIPPALGLGLAVLWGTAVIPLVAPAKAAPRDPSHPPPPPPRAPGFPSRAPDFDVLPGFQNPPPGYGEVPFWWWTGDPLDRERLLWQIEELHRKGISGVQVNYAHEDTPGWPTYPAEPAIFSEAWWDIWGFVAGECAKREMGIGLSGYTLDWPNGQSLVSRTIYSEPALVGQELRVASRTRASANQAAAFEIPSEAVAITAYPIRDGTLDPAGTDLGITEPGIRREWQPANGEWEVWVWVRRAKPGSLNPMHPLAGRRVIEKFFQRFQDAAPGGSAQGLNYFFHDELQFGVEDPIWTEDFAVEFQARKGYDVREAWPALFTDIGPTTSKARLDYHDVRMQLIEERYFQPIFDWHWSRGLIYGCDQGSRGRDPLEFGDYFRAVRWYTAPGHDTPGGRADLIKGKVSSSIAHLYRRPRVWLEGYHSLGWGATPARLMQATCENYVYGCNLLNLHGLYYTTHGGFWEWAPPSYHFRMPYWDHFGAFLRYFERLSYLLSQGVHRCEIAVLYPVTPGQAGLGGREATELAFKIGTELFASGRDFIFLDDDSLARARIEGGRLHVADADYRVLILPAMRAIRWPSLVQAEAFAKAGGLVMAVGGLPEASDRRGRDDPELQARVRNLFSTTVAEAPEAPSTAVRSQDGAGLGLALFPSADDLRAELNRALRSVPPEVSATTPFKAVHRRIGPRDVFLVTDAPRGATCTFRATGRVELWDPWTGGTRPILTASSSPDGTRVRLPLGPEEAQVIVFSPGPRPASVIETDLDEVTQVVRSDRGWALTGYAASAGPKTAVLERPGGLSHLSGEAPATSIIPLAGDWEFELQPTLDNRWGDFRLPPSTNRIGPEARRFRYAEERTSHPGWEAVDTNDSEWALETCGFGQKFWKLGPLPDDPRVNGFEVQMAGAQGIDPSTPVIVGDRPMTWTPYAFSWRWGKEGDPGHQGYHGLKKNVSDDFLCLGQPANALNETVYRAEPGGHRYYLWTTVITPVATRAIVRMGGLTPTAVYLDGQPVLNSLHDLTLSAGRHPLLLRFDAPGRGHFVLQRRDAGAPTTRTPLAMRWHDLPGRLEYDVRPAEPDPVGWYRFTAPPGLRAMTFRAQGTVEVWIDGIPCQVNRLPTPDQPLSGELWRAVPKTASLQKATVAVRIVQERGRYGGSTLPEPVQIDCGPGRFPAGDWAQGTVLEGYSGGAWYRRDVLLDPLPPKGRVLLEMGDVVATAEVRMNGATAGIRVAPPWVVDLTPHARAGLNRLEVLVYNTLANHYLTIPTRYRGDLRSGLLGPVQLRVQPATELTE